MPAKRYRVRLTAEERKELNGQVNTGTGSGRIAAKLEIHYTPKHGSWLNMAEIELSVLHRQCLNARIPDKQTLMQRVSAWQNCRNASASTVNWRFTTADARISLAHLYPSMNDC